MLIKFLDGSDREVQHLRGANLRGADLNWKSHNLLSEILRQSAGDDVAKLKIAGLPLVCCGWCWEEFLALDDPLRDWALDELAKWVQQPNDGSPEEILARAEALKGRDK